MRDIIDLVESYSFALQKKWWANSFTGELLSIPQNIADHDEYLHEHLDEFLTDDEIEQCGGDSDEDEFSPGSSLSDAILEMCYKKGWEAVLYDGNNNYLHLRGTASSTTTTALVKIANRINHDYPIVHLFIDILEADDKIRHYNLKDNDLTRFLKRGVLPA